MNRSFVYWICIAGYCIAAAADRAEPTGPVVGDGMSTVESTGEQREFRWADPQNRWLLKGNTNEGLNFLGLDSEGAGREGTNLLASAIELRWKGADGATAVWQKRAEDGVCSVFAKRGQGKLEWGISAEHHILSWTLRYVGEGSVEDLVVEFPFNALLGGAVLIPSDVDGACRGVGPWLLVAPDFGHLLIEVESSTPWFGVNTGTRGGSAHNAPIAGVDPRLKGQAWLEAVKIPDYRAGTLRLRLAASQPLPAGVAVTIRLSAAELTTPEGIDPLVWKRIRRAYLNHWQPCGAWTDPQMVHVLANNVLSDPASCSLWFYSEPMLCWHKPIEGIDVIPLLRHSLDYWLTQGVSAQGHVNAFGKMYDLYTFTGPALIIAAWDYWRLTGDNAWLQGPGNGPDRLETLHRVADYVLRRDVDGDGLIESIHSGNSGTLRDPDRADIWFEMMNFGWKNSWTNLLAYRAFLCMAQMVEATGQAEGAAYYRRHAERLRTAFVDRMLGSNGWFVSWISQDGQIHDYCHTFINGMAVAYGVVPPEQGKEILSRVVAQSKSIGFTCWHLGVPANLISCPPEDLIQPRVGLDGQPIWGTFGIQDRAYWQQDMFGYRYPNGTIHPPLVWPYLLGLQVAGLTEEADRILEAMMGSAEDGLFQNGIVNVGYGGAEHFHIDGTTCGYEGYLPESFNFLMAAFTRNPALRSRLLEPLEQAR